VRFESVHARRVAGDSDIQASAYSLSKRPRGWRPDLTRRFAPPSPPSGRGAVHAFSGLRVISG
jgi:hypothetical protein